MMSIKSRQLARAEVGANFGALAPPRTAQSFASGSEYTERLDPIRETLIDKFRDGTINAVTDFRQLSKIATAIDGLGIAHRTAKRSLDRVFDADDETSIRDAYEDTVGFEYDEQRASQRVQSLTEFFDEIIESGQQEELDETFLKEVRRLYRRLKKLLGE